MSADRRDQIKSIFSQAVELDPSSRGAFLDEVCGRDDALRTEIESLLAVANQAPKAFMHAAAYRPEQADEPGRSGGGSVLPVRLGRYTILRRLGEGGMGCVYEARQDNPSRTVAVKLIRAIFATPQVLKRFDREAQLLGQLQHPGIATVYEAGNADVEFPAGVLAAQPFFAMERILGTPLDEYVAREKLDTRAILSLFLRICDAVQHAHDRGVIHRDLKPHNILVDAAGMPKILDFGVARLVDLDAATATMQTDAGQLVGTLPYMSPEQVQGAGRDVDARADVYALGVMLYQILSGRLPLDVRGRSLPEAARLIQESDPTRLGSIDRSLRGDVETIVEKALEKSKARRYESAAALAADIRRYLHDEPIVARPATTWYQLQKFARRNRGLVAGAAVGTTALIVGLVVAVMQAYAAVGARNLAREGERVSRDNAYLASMSAAASALFNDDVALARRSLERAPASLRGWEWRHLSAQLDQSLVTVPTGGMIVHPHPHFLHDESGESFILTTDQGVLRWDLRTGARMDDLGPPGAVATTNRAGTILASLASRTLTVQYLTQGSRQVFSLDQFSVPPFGRLGQMEISGDGNTIYLGWPMRALAIDLRTGQLANRKLDNRGVCDLSVSDQTRAAFSAAVRDRPAIWRVTDDELIALSEDGPPGRCIDLSPDGEWAIVGYQDSTIRAWDLRGPRPRPRLAPVHANVISDIVFNPDGTVIASASMNRSITFWDAQTLAPLVRVGGHSSGVQGLAFSPDGTRLVSVAADDSVRVWDGRLTADPGVLAGHSSFIYPVAFSQDGALIASAGWDNTIRLWDAQTYEDVAVLDRSPTAASDFVVSLAFSRDDNRLLSLEVGALRVWDLSTGRVAARLNASSEYAWTSLGSAGRLRVHTAFLRDDLRIPLLWARHEQTVPVWDTATGRVGSMSVAGLSGLGPLLQSPGDEYVLLIGARSLEPPDVGPSDPILQAFSTQRGGVSPSLPEIASPAVFAPDASAARLAARRTDDKSVVGIWNLADGTEEGRLAGHAGEVNAIAFSPDGSRIATGGADQTVRIWDARMFTEIVQLRGHSSYVWSLAFSPDGTQLVSGSGDGTVRVWDTRPFREVVDARDERDGLISRLASRVHERLRNTPPADTLRQFQDDTSLSLRERQVIRQMVIRAAMHRSERSHQ